MFSRKGAKNAKKKLFNINRLPLRALPALLNLFCFCLTGAALRKIVTFYEPFNVDCFALHCRYIEIPEAGNSVISVIRETCMIYNLSIAYIKLHIVLVSVKNPRLKYSKIG